jgi:dihydrodipicolinate synthase/N-acetylneuraminate lyase
MDAESGARRRFRAGTVIPAHPLALTENFSLDERHQRALTRYYLDSGAGGLAVGVHTTEFKIHEPEVGLYRPVLELAAATAADWCGRRRLPRPFMIAGITGNIDRALAEAALAADLGFDAGLLSLGGLPEADEPELVRHARRVAELIPVMGFYLQPAVGGRVLSEGFWRKLIEIENLVGIKIAPFDRYQTLAVVRAAAASGRAGRIALYTGNDDNIIPDLLTTYELAGPDGPVALRIVGGLLGHWAYWTLRASEQLTAVHAAVEAGSVPASLLTLGAQVTESNRAVFDPEHGYRGCISGILYVLAKSGLVGGVRTLGEKEELSPGQAERIDAVIRAYPHLTDEEFVAENLKRWLAD